MNQQIYKLEREKSKRILPIIFGIFFFLLTVSLAQALTIEELIDSYSFDYYGEEIGAVSISDSLISNTLSFDINIVGAVAGDYFFYIDLEDAGGVVSGEAVGDLTSSGGDIQINISTHYLSGIGQFNYTLRIYDSGGSLVYRKGDLVTEGNLSYDSGYEVFEIVDSNVGNDYVGLNVSIYSSVAVVENVSVFLGYEDEIISVTSEESLEVGVNHIILEIDGDVLGATHYDGVYNITGVLIGEKLILFNYATASYDYEDFVKTSYLSSYDSSFVDPDSDNLTDYLQFDFGVEIKEAGAYRVEADVYDLSGQYLTSISGSENFTVGGGNIVAGTDGGLLYSLGVDGPYLISIVRLFFDGVEIDSARDAYVTEDISYYNFERTPLPDLKISLDVENDGTDYLINVTVENIGEAAAFNIYVDLFDNVNYSEKVFYDFLDVGESHVFSFVSENLNIETLVAIVDFDNLIDEESEGNNVAFYDGFFLDDDFFEDCLGIYTGSAKSSMSSISVINNIGDSYFASGRTWYNTNSLLDGGVTLIGDSSNKLKVGKSMNCYFKLSSITFSGETLAVSSNSMKQAKVYSKENADGDLEILREKYNFKLSDGMHIVGSGKYDAEGNRSSVKVRCVNKVAKKTCKRGCGDERREDKRVCRDNYFNDRRECKEARASCFRDCKMISKSEKKGCMRSCRSEAKECRGNASGEYGSCVDPLRDVENVCKSECSDAYDIGSEYDVDGVMTLSMFDVLGECGYLR